MQRLYFLFITLITWQFSFTPASYAQVITTFAGTDTAGYSGDGGPAISAEILRPLCMASDISGNIYFVDEGNLAVREINAEGIINTIAGGSSAAFYGDGHAATASNLIDPFGIAVDNAGNIYISELAESVIRKVDPAGIITTIAGGGGRYADTSQMATNAMLINPAGLAIDESGNLYVADQGNHVVRKIDATGIISTIAGNSSYSLGGENVPATATALADPIGIAIDHAQNIYFSDEGFTTGTAVIRKISHDTITTYAGGGTASDTGIMPATACQLGIPMQLAADPAGNIYFTDMLSSIVYKITPDGMMQPYAGSEPDTTGGTIGDGGPAKNAYLSGPTGITLDNSGNMYISQTGDHRIRKITDYLSVPQLQVAKFKIFPNPATSVLNVISNFPLRHIDIVDAIGQIVFSRDYNSAEVIINVRDFIPGIYFLKIDNLPNGSFVKSE